MPASIWAWRDGIWPCPACSTWPMTTCWTWSGATPARSRAALIAIPPSSVAGSEDRPPPSFPTGVRAALRITVLGMPEHSSIRARMDVRATTEAPAETGADTIAIGAVRGRGERRRARHARGGALGALVECGRGARGVPQARADPRRRQALAGRRPRQARRVRPRARPDRRRRRARPRPRARRALAVLGAPAPRLRRPRRRLRRGHRDGRLRVHDVQERRRRGRRRPRARRAGRLRPPRRRRARRDGPHRRRVGQPHPRPPEPPRQRPHADRADRARPRDRRQATTRSASR